MPSIVNVIAVAFALCVGGVAGACHAWLTYKAPTPVTIRYCTTTSVEPDCVEARTRYEREHPKPIAPCGPGETPP